MITVRARILPPVPLQYKSANRPKTFPTSNGNWDIRDRHFSDARQLRNWTFIKFIDNDVSRQHIDSFRGIIRRSGMNSDDPVPPNGVTEPLRTGKAYDDFNDKKIQQTFETASKKGLKVLLIILPDKSAFIYSRVKFWADVKYGRLYILRWEI